MTKMFEALKAAENFIAGFEGDEMQDGIDALLELVRGAIAVKQQPVTTTAKVYDALRDAGLIARRADGYFGSPNDADETLTDFNLVPGEQVIA